MPSPFILIQLIRKLDQPFSDIRPGEGTIATGDGLRSAALETLGGHADLGIAFPQPGLHTCSE